MLCLTTFKKGRSNENARPTNLFGLDFDDQGNQINEVITYLGTLGCNWFLYTTHSHKPTHHKFRVILELAQSIPDADENRLVFMVLNSLFGKQGFALDDACKNISRLWYRPASPSSASPCQCHKRTDLGPLDISPQLALARKEQRELVEFQDREAKRAKAKSPIRKFFNPDNALLSVV
ncbi:hypothetical protein [Komagataeibacter sp. FNDCF1]|uniref:hypothetical protein n=1 Tax=Komagataeibacter sp. FNDCF1 TaxID=2878681 RepID=UPI001E2E5966|nr:hypothetical protein [Komagataeibacter sp. FNDCF1]MCE2565041.1 hypothetical protein [Komagataeibacter sp. FNDCF1]